MESQARARKAGERGKEQKTRQNQERAEINTLGWANSD
jgi:hypothetical protein